MTTTRSHARTGSTTAVGSGAPRAADVPLPDGFRIEPDAALHEVAGGWLGGSPLRLVRLTPAGRAAWPQLREHGVTSPVTGALARRLTDAGLAHPLPGQGCGQVIGPDQLTVVVPVLGRPRMLDDLLAELVSAIAAEFVVVVDDGSPDARAVAHVVLRHGVRLVRRESTGGPAAARNTGLHHVRTDFVAFVDSDVRPGSDWLTGLAPHFRDPLVAAVAPRIVAHGTPAGTVGRYGAAHGALDLGDRPARVVAGSRVGYVPSALLLARRSALQDVARGGDVFEPRMRHGEDVDLVWRLDAAGWRVRYDPAVRVGHVEPVSWRALLARRFHYGTSAAPLAAAHPQAFAPLVVAPWPMLAVVASLTGRPVVAVAAVAAATWRTRRSLASAGAGAAAPVVRLTARGLRDTWLGTGRYLTQTAGPGLVVAALLPGSTRRRLVATALLVGPPLTSWRPRGRRRAGLDPARFVLAGVADEIAYGAGVWRGCLRTRDLSALRPRRARTADRRRSR